MNNLLNLQETLKDFKVSYKENARYNTLIITRLDYKGVITAYSNHNRDNKTGYRSYEIICNVSGNNIELSKEFTFKGNQYKEAESKLNQLFNILKSFGGKL